MKKVYLSLILMFLVSIFVLGCGGGEIPSADNLKFKASNVVFRNSTVKASDEFTDQKVYADDVVLNNANTSLTADNVQGAFEETQPKLSEIIVGEWDVVCYKSAYGSYDAKIKTGTVTFNNDNTFSFTGVGQDFCSYYDSFWEVTPVKYQIFDESILNCSFDIIDTPHQNAQEKISRIRDFTLISSNKLVSKNVNEDYIFILTRKQ